MEATVFRWGVACAVGLRAAPALAALQAGVNTFTSRDSVFDVAGDPVCCGSLPHLADSLHRAERAEFLARHAVTECVAELAEPGTAPLPCFLALPEPSSGPPLPAQALRRAFDGVCTGTGEAVRMSIDRRHIYAKGRAAGFEAVTAALRSIETGMCKVALVGAIDSQADNATLRQLSQDNRLLSKRNPGGLIPSEAAAFILLAHPALVPPRLGRARVRACATAREPHPFAHSEPSSAQGLAAVFRDLRSRFEGRTDAVFSAQSGEAFFGREFSYAYLRNAELIPEPLKVVTLGSKIGDTGAAAGLLAVITAAASLHPPLIARRHQPNRSALVFGSSDTGAVGGCVLTR